MKHRYHHHKSDAQSATCMLTGMAIGAAAMYFLDPIFGARRRGMVRGKLYSSTRHAGEALAKTAEYTWDHSKGLVSQTIGRFRHDDASDEVICQRVRSAMGRVVGHPSAIVVSSDEGRVTLSGPILCSEVPGLLSAVASIRGVKSLHNNLTPYDAPGNVPELQGEPRVRGHRWGLMRENWNPFTRLMAGMAGSTAIALAAARRDWVSSLLGGCGLFLVARSLSNLPAKRLTGIGAGPRAIDVQKTITLLAPIDQVFEFFANYQNFPRFMSNVREVSGSGERSHWVVAGPMGAEISWDAELTMFVPNEVIAWKSVEGAAIENAGVIRFTQETGGTRVDIKLSYNPIAGAIGHLIARLFGADPKSEMDADLMRVKAYLETGQRAHDVAAPEQEINI